MKIAKTVKYSYLTLLLISLTGCAQDKTLSPPDDAEWVTVSMQLPDTVEPEVLKVMYRSEECQKKVTMMDGSKGYISGYNLVGYDFEKKNNGLYEKKIAQQGGGGCSWALSNITAGIKYKDISQFNENITGNYPSEVIFVFDDNNPQRYGATYEKVSGDVKVEKEYFPLIKKRFMRDGSSEQTFSLYSEKDYFTYYVNNTKNILIKPLVYSKYVTKWIGVRGSEPNEYGSYHTGIYPDGFIDNKADSDPDFNKLQAITKSKKTKK